MTTDDLPLKIVNSTIEMADDLAALQRIVFFTLTEDELLSPENFRRHIEIFPEGQFAVFAIVDGKERLVASTSTFRTNFDFDHPDHTFNEIVGGGWFTNHDPNGEWLYGADMAVHPDFRRRGIGSRLYAARRELVKRLNLRGEIAGGMLPGYAKYRDKMTLEAYIEGVIAGEVEGQTLAMQIKNGFTVRGILHDHITDPRTDNRAALIVRDNPDYKPSSTG